MSDIRTERIVLKEGREGYDLIRNFCFESKNLYNYANYILRRAFKEKDYTLFGKYNLRDYIRKDLVEEEGNPLSRQYNAHAGYGTIQILMNNWQSYFVAIRSYNKNPEKFKVRPKIPGYLPKDGHFIVTTDRASVKDGVVRFARSLCGFTVSFNKADEIKCVRFVPKYNHIIIELCYKVELPEIKEDNARYLSIDLGVDNFATITSNVENFQPLVVNGKGLKSMNQYYNKQVAHYQSVADSLGQDKKTDRLTLMYEKRNRRVYDFMHKASKYVLDVALEYNISRVVIGYNAGWKNEVNLGSKVNQNFVSIPYLQFIQKLRYKLENYGIELVVTEESYTSKTSFLDGEYPEKLKEYKGVRRVRGLFVSAGGTRVNADVNASYQILKKVFPKAYAEGIEGIRVYPVQVNISNI